MIRLPLWRQARRRHGRTSSPIFWHRRRVRRLQLFSHRRRHFSNAAPVAGRSRHAHRYDFDGALAEQVLVPTRAARSWRAGCLGEAARTRRVWRPISRALTSQFNKSTRLRRSFQLPPRGAASGCCACFLRHKEANNLFSQALKWVKLQHPQRSTLGHALANRYYSQSKRHALSEAHPQGAAGKEPALMRTA